MTDNKMTCYEVTDEDIANMLRGFSLDEVCRYHREHGGVICNQKRRTDADCEKCGWNPRVSRRRRIKIKKWIEEVGPWE